jgi:hypothetical protein
MRDWGKRLHGVSPARTGVPFFFSLQPRYAWCSVTMPSPSCDAVNASPFRIFAVRIVSLWSWACSFLQGRTGRPLLSMNVSRESSLFEVVVRKPILLMTVLTTRIVGQLPFAFSSQLAQIALEPDPPVRRFLFIRRQSNRSPFAVERSKPDVRALFPKTSACQGFRVLSPAIHNEISFHRDHRTGL